MDYSDRHEASSKMRHEVGHYVKAVYDFAAQESGELSLRVGDIIRITDVIDKDWLQGEAIYGGSGSFPANYVEKLVLPDTRMGQRVFVALVDFPAEQSGDLELAKGDIILGLEQVDENWWKGKNGPLRGIFPLSCVQELVVPTEGPRSRSASLRSRSSSIMSRQESLASQPVPETMFARALVDVLPQIEGELGFQLGDLITVKEIIDDDWFYGECHNKVGLVSTICIEFLDNGDDAPLENSGHLEGGVKQGWTESSSCQRDEAAYSHERSIHTDRNPTLQSVVSYTSENTRSHDAEITPYAKTLYPFQAQLPSELSFGDNEIVTLIQHVDEDWIEGELDGKIGLFPANFVEIIVDCPYAFNSAPVPETLNSVTATSDDQTGQFDKEAGNTISDASSKAEQVSKNNLGKDRGAGDSLERITQNGHDAVLSDHISEPSLALVLHNFEGQVEGDLCVKEGDTIEVLRIVDSDWIEACGESGTVGLVPTNHVEIITGGPQKISTATSSREKHDAIVNSEATNSSRTSSLSDKPVTEREVGDASVPKSGVNALDSNQETSLSSEQKPHVHSATSAPSTTAASTTVLSSATSQNADPPGARPGGVVNDNKPKPPPEKPKLLPKPKLAPKPAVAAKPLFVPKPFVPKQSSFGHVTSPTEKTSFTEPGSASDDGKEKKIFTDLDTNQSLDNIVQAELQRAKTEGERSRGSSFADEDKRSSSESFSSSVSDDQTSRTLAPVLQTNSSSPDFTQHNLAKIEELSVDKSVSDTQVPLEGSVHGVDLVSGHTSSSEAPAGSSSLAPPSVSLNRSTSDGGVSDVTMRTKAPPSGAVSHRHSMPPARPVPPPPTTSLGKSDSKHLSYVNKAYEHEGEGRLLGVDVSQEPCRPPPPTRPIPRPPPPVIAAAAVSSEQTASDAQPRIKRPPPRPTGPRVASVPSKTPLEPVRVDTTSKPIPHRPAPAAPGPRRPAPVAPGFGGAAAGQIPPRPTTISGATTTPPKRPPPRGVTTTKSPSDLMRFSPEPVSDDEGNSEIVADLKRRLQENNADIQKYEQSRQELETKLSQQDEVEQTETQDSLQFVTQTLQGLREEEQRLKGNLFSVSPREERLEKARLLEEQRASEEEQRQVEERKLAAALRAKRREKREKVLQELVDTEKDYLFDLQLCLATFFDSTSKVKVPSSVDLDMLVGNMEEIADVSQRLLTSLESAISGKDFYDQVVGTAFVALAEDMKNTYAPYCRHHDDVIAIMEKYKEIPEVCQFFSAKVEEMRRQTNIFDVEAILIKPVQRVLKYPLLLNELIKSTEDGHPDKAAIMNAIRAMTDVATAINEYKRRKDLVYKYKKDSDQSFSNKIAKLNLHSIKKKSSRMRGRLSTGLGIGLQLRDENFEREEMKFRGAEKAIKVLLRSVMLYMDHLQEVVACQENLAADISDFYGDQSCEEVTRYMTVHQRIMGHYKTLTETVEQLVLIPLNKLVAMLNGPNNVIEKRFDKLLDYNNLLGRGKDEKIVQAAKNDYEAMNAQLLDELPRLYNLTLDLMRHCMAAYVRAQRDFMDQSLKENCILLELPSMLGAGDNVMECFNIGHSAALDHISMLSFIPRGFNPKVDAFRLDRKSGARQSFDLSKPAPTIQSISQSDSQRVYLRQTYGADKLYRVTQTMAAQDVMDMAVTQGMLLGVIKDRDPMGGRSRWYVDDGVNKGFVQSSVLTKASASPMGSLSDLTGDEGSDTASVYSASMEDMELLSLQGNTNQGQLYPDMTEVSGSKTPSPYPGQAPYEYYCAEYPFTARSDNEVTLFAGQVVVVLQKQDMDGNTEWWMVDADGFQGYAPANYLRKMN